MSKASDASIVNAKLHEGVIYKLRGGGRFCVIRAFDDGDAILQSIMSGYTFTARGVTLHADGTIEWRCSTDGKFEPLPEGHR